MHNFIITTPSSLCTVSFFPLALLFVRVIKAAILYWLTTCRWWLNQRQIASLSIYFILHATLSWIWLFCLIFQPHKIICDYIITDTVHMYIIMAMHYTIAHTPYLYTLIHESVARRFCTTFNFSCVIHQTLYIWFDWCVSNQHHSFSRHDE